MCLKECFFKKKIKTTVIDATVIIQCHTDWAFLFNSRRTRASPLEEHQPPARPCEPFGPPKTSERRFRHNGGPSLPAGCGPSQAASGQYATSAAGAGPAAFLALCCHLAGSGRHGPAPVLEAWVSCHGWDTTASTRACRAGPTVWPWAEWGGGTVHFKVEKPNPAGRLAPKSLGYDYADNESLSLAFV